MSPWPFKFKVFYLGLLFTLSPDALPLVLEANSDSVLRTQLEHPASALRRLSPGPRPPSSAHDSPSSAWLLGRGLCENGGGDLGLVSGAPTVLGPQGLESLWLIPLLSK